MSDFTGASNFHLFQLCLGEGKYRKWLGVDERCFLFSPGRSEQTKEACASCLSPVVLCSSFPGLCKCLETCNLYTTQVVPLTPGLASDSQR